MSADAFPRVAARGVHALMVGVILAPGAALEAQAIRTLTAPPPYTIDQWTARDGLPQNSVNAIAQTPDGYLWVGTFGGLARFDGMAFDVIQRVDSSGRHVDRVLALAVAPDSALWVGTENGLLRYKGGAFAVYKREDGLPDDRIHALHVDRTGALWIGADRGGVARFADGAFTIFAEADGLPLHQVRSIIEDRAGTLWLNAADRFFTVDDGRLTAERWRTFPAPGAMHMLLEDLAGAKWFRVAGGLARLERERVTVFPLEHAGADPWVMVQDPEGGYWLGGFGRGALHLQVGANGLSEVAYPLPDGQTGYGVRAAYVGFEGNVWLGTNTAGLLRAKRNLFTTYTTADGLSHDVVTAVYQDAGGTVWVGTNCGGLNALDRRGRVRTFRSPACVFALTEAPPGTLWVGTYGGGLTRIVGGRVEPVGRAGGLLDGVVLALLTDRDGTVWVGTRTGGLAAVERGRVAATYTTEDGLAHNSVRAITQARDGSLWIGTFEGLSRFAGGRFTTYGPEDGLSSAYVRAIHEDSAGTLWIGTFGGGLNRFRDGVFVPITEAEGLADNVVSSILDDGRGNLWMSGNRGIFRVERAQLDAVADGRLARVHSVLYGTADGLRTAETNGGFQPAAWRDGQGRFWFPTIEGVAVVDPTRATTFQHPPTVAVVDVSVNGAARRPRGPMELGPGRPNLEFRYTGLSLTAPERVTFRYRLEGFDDGWVEAGRRRVAYYPRLPPGRYRFRVTAANRDGVWADAAAALALRVRAPLWATWWFRGGVVALALGLVVLVLRRRWAAVRREHEIQRAFSRRLIESQEHERRRIAGELHDALGQQLLVVKNRTMMALGVASLDPAAREQLQEISSVTSGALDGVRELAYRLRPHELEHVGLSETLRDMLQAAAESSPIRFDVAVADVDGCLTPEGEMHLYRVVQEAVNNILKHSAATEARIHVSRDAGACRVVLSDDGRGFATPPAGSGGFGLSGMAERVRMLGGRLDIASTPGRGTRVEITVSTAAAAPSSPASVRDAAP